MGNKKENKMNMKQALETVLDLADSAALTDCDGEELLEQKAARQDDAINMVRELLESMD